jgi:hypothetical protein
MSLRGSSRGRADQEANVTYRRKHLLAKAAIVVGATLASTLAVSTAASADGPGQGIPWVVSLGDSYISGEGGRWAGNSNWRSNPTDALGWSAYNDGPSGNSELIPACHRSRAAEVHIFGYNNQSLNLACSGADPFSQTFASGAFKPGLDFYGPNSKGQKSQVVLLQEFAKTHNVKMINVSIGGNQFKFADIVEQCVKDYVTSLLLGKDVCNNDSSITRWLLAARAEENARSITSAIENIENAMANAGYLRSMFTIVVQTYPSPIAPGAQMRYAENLGRQSVGGCGFWNEDADWANNFVLPMMNTAVKNGVRGVYASNVKVLDVSSAFNGRRLCEKTVGLYEEKGLGSWNAPGAADQVEWVTQIRAVPGVSVGFLPLVAPAPYIRQEGLHPNYWGELALRNCVRQAWNNGSPKGGACTRGTGLNNNGEPNMTLA